MSAGVSAYDWRDYLHSRVVAAMAKGMTRVEAFQHVAEEHRTRPGVVAAAYHRIEREEGR